MLRSNAFSMSKTESAFRIEQNRLRAQSYGNFFRCKTQILLLPSKKRSMPATKNSTDIESQFGVAFKLKH